MYRSLTMRLCAGASVLFAAAILTETAIAQTQNSTYQYQYDAVGNRTQIIDPLNRVTNQIYDPLNRLQQQLEPAPIAGAARPVINYSYDGLDQLVSVTDPRNLVTSYTTTGLGDQTTISSPDTGTTVNTYDATGNVLTSTDAKSQATSYQYDALNRIVLISYADGKQVIYQYDQGTYGLGRLTQLTDDSGSIGYTYDSIGSLIAETHTINAIAYVTRYSYDSPGRLAGLTYPSGRILTYTRDTMGRISGVTTSKDGINQVIVSQVSYHPFGGIKSYVDGAGEIITRNIDLDGRIKSYTMGNTTQVVGYDAASRISFLSDANNPANTANYGYDDLDRLTQYTGAASNQSFGYDATGNRINQVIGANSYQSVINPGSNKLTQVTGSGISNGYAYDANGSRINDATRQYGYDARGRMISSITTPGTSTVQYRINGLGQRVQKISPTNNTVYHYSNGQLISESTAQGAFQKDYLYLNDMPVAVFQ